MLRIAIPAFFISLALTTQAQLSNNGFETVDITATDTVPAGWSAGDYGCGISNNPHSGNYALSVWNWYYYAQGFAFNGLDEPWTLPSPGSPYLYGGEPISFAPISLTGFYLYDTSLNGGMIDSAFVQVTLSRYNTATNAREAVGLGEIRLPVATQYTPFEVPVAYSSSLMPDTVVVAISSSMNGFCTSSDGNCLYFTVDDLMLTSLSGLVDFNHKAENVRVYPNPSHDRVTIDAAPHTEKAEWCRLIATNGMQVLQQELTGNKVVLDITALEPGLYFFQLGNSAGKTFHTGKLTVQP